MKAQERLDRIMTSCREQMQEEVSALLGKSLKLAESESRVLSKEDYFTQPAGKIVLAHIQLEGEVEGHGCLIVPIKDAVRIGGTLIMLPDTELDSVIADEKYTEEIEDSYGEIANIICGSMTATFEEQYPKTFRLVRTEQEIILPVNVDIEADEPVADGSYYLMSFSMLLEGQEMGDLQILLPAVSFGLVEEPQPEEETVEPEQGKPGATADVAEEEAAATGTLQQEDNSESAEEVGTISQPEEQAAAAAVSPAKPKRDVGKQQKLIDGLLAACMEKLGEEIGALLGGTLKVTPEENNIFSKGDLLEQAGGKQIMARMEVRGDGSGESFLFADIKDAIFLGGSLIMLPDSELEETMRNEEFGPDAEDAYGEIANIIAGTYTAVFEGQYRKNLGFVKTALETVVPVKIDPDSDETIPNQLYYLSVGTMKYNDKELGRVQVAFPAEILELEELGQPEPEEAAQATAQPSVGDQAGDAAPVQSSAQTDAGPAEGSARAQTLHELDPSTDILIFTDDNDEGRNIAAALQTLGYVPCVLHFKDPVNNFLSGSIRLAFLVMKEVGEQGFGVAIKISSAGHSVPLVAAGPGWTRTMVLKAVKYGADDILITPATEADVREKIEANLTRIAA